MRLCEYRFLDWFKNQIFSTLSQHYYIMYVYITNIYATHLCESDVSFENVVIITRVSLSPRCPSLSSFIYPCPFHPTSHLLFDFKWRCTGTRTREPQTAGYRYKNTRCEFDWHRGVVALVTPPSKKRTYTPCVTQPRNIVYVTAQKIIPVALDRCVYGCVIIDGKKKKERGEKIQKH